MVSHRCRSSDPVSLGYRNNNVVITVISTYKFPVPGWIDNFYGPTGVTAGAGTGVIRTLRCNPSAKADMVPVDLCVNGIIATAWDVSNRYHT